MARGQSLQDPFLNALRKERVPVSIYLVNGIKLQGQVDSFDQFVVLLKNSVSQMVYKHAMAAAVPVQAVAIRYPPPAGAHPTVPFTGDDSFVPHLWRMLGEPRIEAKLVFCPPLPVTDCDRRTLAERSRGRIAQVLAAAYPQPANVTVASSALQAAVTPAGEHAGPRHPETRSWKTLTRPANPAPGASSSTASIRR